MNGGVPAGEGDWFARNADRRNATAFINTNPAYFAAECASAIKEGRLVLATPTPPIEGRDADVERAKVREAVAKGLAAFIADEPDYDMSRRMIREATEYIMAQPGIFALQALGERG